LSIRNFTTYLLVNKRLPLLNPHY